MSEGAYIEGLYSYVRVEHPDGAKVVQIQLDDGRAVGELRVLSTASLPLAPGSYRLVSFQRVCNGHCGLLGPPTDRCSTSLRIEEGAPREVRILLRPPGCTIELR